MTQANVVDQPVTHAPPLTRASHAVAVSSPMEAPRATHRRQRRAWGILRWAPFLLVVGLPTALTGVYFGFIASDRYVAESQFVVRSAERSVATGLGAILQTTGMSSGQEDAYLVQSFMTSRDALASLEKTVGFSDLMGKLGADWLAAWPNPIDADNFEGLYDYYGRRVSVTRNVSSGVSTLRVEAFTPDDAKVIASALLDAGEDLINKMNQRSQRDTVALARDEVNLAEQRVAENQREFNAFRRQQGIVNPMADTEMRLGMVAQLSSEIAGLEADARRLEETARNSPKLPALRARIAALTEQVNSESSKLVGADGGLADSYARYETLVLEQKFAQEALQTARAAMEQARADARRKQLYLEAVVEPRAPDDSRAPKRVQMTLAVFAGAFLLYAVGWLLMANAREHRG